MTVWLGGASKGCVKLSGDVREFFGLANDSEKRDEVKDGEDASGGGG
jgi:hypothetical protein